jgi:hypothetical protein
MADETEIGPVKPRRDLARARDVTFETSRLTSHTGLRREVRTYAAFGNADAAFEHVPCSSEFVGFTRAV